VLQVSDEEQLKVQWYGRMSELSGNEAAFQDPVSLKLTRFLKWSDIRGCALTISGLCTSRTISPTSTDGQSSMSCWYVPNHRRHTSITRPTSFLVSIISLPDDRLIAGPLYSCTRRVHVASSARARFLDEKRTWHPFGKWAVCLPQTCTREAGAR
jgi:hypothetical protein